MKRCLCIDASVLKSNHVITQGTFYCRKRYYILMVYYNMLYLAGNAKLCFYSSRILNARILLCVFTLCYQYLHYIHFSILQSTALVSLCNIYTNQRDNIYTLTRLEALTRNCYAPSGVYYYLTIYFLQINYRTLHFLYTC